MRSLLLTIHVFGVVIWVGGMFFAHFCLRPVATEQLLPVQRFPLMAAVLGRFFKFVAVAVIAIIGSGFSILATIGFAQAPVYLHLMSGSGLLMAAIFACIYFVFYRKLQRMVVKHDWPSAGAVMGRIRLLVAINLWLGTITILLATLAPRFS